MRFSPCHEQEVEVRTNSAAYGSVPAYRCHGGVLRAGCIRPTTVGVAPTAGVRTAVTGAPLSIGLRVAGELFTPAAMVDSDEALAGGVAAGLWAKLGMGSRAEATMYAALSLLCMAPSFSGNRGARISASREQTQY